MDREAQMTPEITIFPFLLPVPGVSHGCETPAMFLVLPIRGFSAGNLYVAGFRGV